MANLWYVSVTREDAGNSDRKNSELYILLACRLVRKWATIWSFLLNVLGSITVPKTAGTITENKDNHESRLIRLLHGFLLKIVVMLEDAQVNTLYHPKLILSYWSHVLFSLHEERLAGFYLYLPLTCFLYCKNHFPHNGNQWQAVNDTENKGNKNS